MCANLQTVRGMMGARPDILGAHLEGPFLALSRKGAHDPECLKDPVPEYVDRLLHAANGCLRQITIAPELPHGIDAIRRFAAAGVFLRWDIAMPIMQPPAEVLIRVLAL